MGKAEHSDQMVLRITKVKTEHLAQRLSTKKKEIMVKKLPVTAKVSKCSFLSVV